MQLTFEEARKRYQSDEQMARVLFAMLELQAVLQQKQQDQLADQAKNKRRENRG
jgi:hypothetical protein